MIKKSVRKKITRNEAKILFQFAQHFVSNYEVLSGDEIDIYSQKMTDFGSFSPLKSLQLHNPLSSHFTIIKWGSIVLVFLYQLRISEKAGFSAAIENLYSDDTIIIFPSKKRYFTRSFGVNFTAPYINIGLIQNRQIDAIRMFITKEIIIKNQNIAFVVLLPRLKKKKIDIYGVGIRWPIDEEKFISALYALNYSVYINEKAFWLDYYNIRH